MQWAFAQNAQGTTKVVLLALADHADASGVCWPSIDALAKKTALSDKTIRRHLAILEALGLVAKQPRRGAGGVYAANAYMLATSGQHVTDGPAVTEGQHVTDGDRPTSGHSVTYGKDNEPSIAVSTTIGTSGQHVTDGCADKPDWRSRMTEAHEILDQPGSHAQGGLAHSAELARLCRAGCDWELDVVPAIQKLAANFKRRGATLRSWGLIAEDALAFRDRRAAGFPATPTVSGRVVTFPRRETAQEREDRIIEELKREGVI